MIWRTNKDLMVFENREELVLFISLFASRTVRLRSIASLYVCTLYVYVCVLSFYPCSVFVLNLNAA